MQERHGEGFHNIGYDHNLDAHLTPRGWAQTAALQQHLTALQPQLGIQLVVVSPLRRTLETASGVFGVRTPPATAAAAAAAAANGPHNSSHAAWVLMRRQAGKPQEVTPQPQLYLPPVKRPVVVAAAGAAAAGAALDAAMSAGVGAGGAGATAGAGGRGNQYASEGPEPLKMVAHEGCRERIGPNVCDKFRDLHVQVADFPGVNFSLMQHSTDVAWEALHDAVCCDGGCYRTGEEESACECRALGSYVWLMDRPESVIAVVSHCGFLVHGMRALGKAMFTTWSEAMLLQYKACSSTAPPKPPLNGMIPSPLHTPIIPHPAAGPPAAPVQELVPPTGGIAAAGPHVLQPDMRPPYDNSSTQLPAGTAAQVDHYHYSPQGVSFGPRLTPPSPPPTPAAQAAEVLRQTAADLGGWMSSDWHNCEARSIQLRWGSAAELLTGPAAQQLAAATARVDGRSGGGVVQQGGSRFLMAAPGDTLTWFPGGTYGIRL